MKIEISRYLDLRYRTKNDTYPVYIRLYYNRKYNLVATGISLTQAEYEKLHSSKVTPALREPLKRIVEVQSLVAEYLEGRNPYNIKLIRQYVEGRDKVIPLPSKKILLSSNVIDWFDEKIGLCRKNKQYGSAETYTSTKSVLIDLFGTTTLPFNFFTVEQLKEIEILLMGKRGIEISTVGKHARNLRAIFKMAINEGIVTMNDYPFGRYKYVIPEVTQAKKSLSRQMMADLVNYDTTNYFERRAIGYFIFSYFGNGMNLKDVAFLKFKDLQSDYLHYYRKKTKNTSAKLNLIRVFVSEEMKVVVQEFGNADTDNENYIFPIIIKDLDEESINTRIHTRNKTINNTLKRISKKLKFDKAVTLGMARHSFANALKQEKVDIAFIQESLGHSSPSITEHYLSSFENNIVVEYVQKLKNYFRSDKE